MSVTALSTSRTVRFFVAEVAAEWDRLPEIMPAHLAGRHLAASDAALVGVQEHGYHRFAWCVTDWLVRICVPEVLAATGFDAEFIKFQFMRPVDAWSVEPALEILHRVHRDLRADAWLDGGPADHRVRDLTEGLTGAPGAAATVHRIDYADREHCASSAAAVAATAACHAAIRLALQNDRLTPEVTARISTLPWSLATVLESRFGGGYR